MKISSKIRSLKFAIYKFLGKFIPYFKKRLEMAFDKIKDDVSQLLIDILEENFKGSINFVGLNCSLGDNEENNIEDIKCEHVNYTNKIISTSLKYEIELMCNPIKTIQLFINYNDGYMTCEFDPKSRINSAIMLDLIKFEEIIKTHTILLVYFKNQVLVSTK